MPRADVMVTLILSLCGKEGKIIVEKFNLLIFLVSSDKKLIFCSFKNI
jgi:hypothetical protein